MLGAPKLKQAARLVVVSLVWSSPHLLLSADQQSKGQGRTASRSQISSYALPFDTHSNDVQPHFRGHNADVIYDAAKKNLPDASQSEFESKSEYSARVLALSNKPFWGVMKAGDQFAFVLGQAWDGVAPAVSASGESQGWVYGYLETHYNAESNEMTVSIPLELTSSDLHQWTALWHRVQTHLGSYVGENAFGAKRIVNRSGVKDTDLIIEGSEWLDFDCDPKIDHKSCSFEIDAQQARTLSKDARVIVIGSLVPPFVSSSNDVDEPSLENPAELHRSYKFLHMQLDQLWIVNIQSGHVIKKYSREKHAAEYTVNLEFRLRKEGSFSYPDARCNPYGHRSDIVSVNYSVDGSEYEHEFLKVLKVSARQFVDVKITYCDIPRVEVLLNGQPYDLQCEKQDQFIGNESQCKRIQLVPTDRSVVTTGTITGTISGNYGNKPDAGSMVYLIQGFGNINSGELFTPFQDKLQIFGEGVTRREYLLQKQSVTDGNGNFQFDGVPEGEYTVIVRSNHTQDKPFNQKIAVKHLTLKAGDSLDASQDFGVSY